MFLIIVLGLLSLWYINDFKRVCISLYNSYVRILSSTSDAENPIIIIIKLVLNSYAQKLLKNIAKGELIYLVILYITVTNILQVIHILYPTVQPYVILSTQSIYLLLIQYVIVVFGFKQVWNYRRFLDEINSTVSIEEVPK